MLKRFLMAASVLIFCTPSLVSACTCSLSPGTCNQDWRSGQVIFTGTVTSKVTADTPIAGIARNAFQFSVAESFRGPAIAGQEITVHTGMGGGDCGYKFEIGTSYLVYAFVSNGRLSTGICTPTSEVSRVPHVIRQLRALQKGERVAALFGMIGTSPVQFADDPFATKPLAGKRVRVIGSRNFVQSTTTDAEGVYSFQSLPADTYRIEIDAPEGMAMWQLSKDEAYKVEVGAKGITGCPASLAFNPDGRIKGKVVDENGNGVAGFVTSEPADEREAEIARRRGGAMGQTTDSGEFDLTSLLPTRYRLVFHPKVRGQIDFRAPAVMSEVITVGLGQHIEDFRFTVPGDRP